MDAILKLSGVEKTFGRIRALWPIDLEISSGQIVGLIGENGAGKSTLIKIISGAVPPSAGTLEWLGRGVRFSTPEQAQAAGIATIHQELAYFGSLTVAENLLLGRPWPRLWWGGVDWKSLHRAARNELGRFGIHVPTTRAFRALSAADKQEVIMARAMAQDGRMLVLDEPTASLTRPEVDALFERLLTMRRAGTTILYVSHRLDEILRLTDRVVVLRDGRVVANRETSSATMNQLVEDMIGRKEERGSDAHPRRDSGRPVLELNGATRRGMFHDVSLTLHAGEVLGLAGLIGSGRSELARAIYGLISLDAGTMRFGGRRWRPRHPREAVKRGIVYVPEERSRQAIVASHAVGESVSIGFSDMMQTLGMIRRTAEVAALEAAVEKYAISTGGLQQNIGTLSGGNQQKAVLARWLERDPQVILLDEPTRGVDVGSRAQIYALIDRFAAAGKAILLISSDFAEVEAVSDRVLVMREGRLSCELRGEELSQENLVLASSGSATCGVSG